MTVTELIEQLEQLDPGAIVVVGGCRACQAEHEVGRVSKADSRHVVVSPRFAIYDGVDWYGDDCEV